MKRVINKKQRNTNYESAQCQCCATYAKTRDEVNEKLGFKQNGEIYSRCKTCMNNLCLQKDVNNEEQQEYNNKHIMTTIKKR